MNDSLRDNFTLVSMAIAFAVGVSCAAIAWLFSRALADVPAENRDYKDPPPIGFRLAWWPIQWLAYYLRRFMSSRVSAKLQTKLRRAGLDYSVTPAQFYASRALLALLLAALAWWTVGSFDHPQRGTTGLRLSVFGQAAIVGALLGWFYPTLWLRDRLMLRRRALLKTLPFYLDIVTLCVEAGLNLQGAMNQAVAKGPKGVLRDEFQRVMRDIRAGKGRAASLRDMAERLTEPSVTGFVTAVVQAESLGMSLGPVLRAQAEQRRSERFLRAEKLAMEAPVKLLLPLIAFIFPCTFIVLFFPIVMKFMASGL